MPAGAHLPPSFILPDLGLLVSSHSITVDVSLYAALRPPAFSVTSNTWMLSQHPWMTSDPSPPTRVRQQQTDAADSKSAARRRTLLDEAHAGKAMFQVPQIH